MVDASDAAKPGKTSTGCPSPRAAPSRQGAQRCWPQAPKERAVQCQPECPGARTALLVCSCIKILAFGATFASKSDDLAIRCKRQLLSSRAFSRPHCSLGNTLGGGFCLTFPFGSGKHDRTSITFNLCCCGPFALRRAALLSAGLGVADLASTALGRRPWVRAGLLRPLPQCPFLGLAVERFFGEAATGTSSPPAAAVGPAWLQLRRLGDGDRGLRPRTRSRNSDGPRPDTRRGRPRRAAPCGRP